MVSEKQKANLRPMNTRSKSEVRKIASKGGKKSGEVRRAKKTLRESFIAMSQLLAPDGIKESYKGVFPNMPKDVTMQEIIVMASMYRASKPSGKGTDYIKLCELVNKYEPADAASEEEVLI